MRLHTQSAHESLSVTAAVVGCLQSTLVTLWQICTGKRVVIFWNTYSSNHAVTKSK